jgi:uncharacterized protein YeeX (DUF496 family)
MTALAVKHGFESSRGYDELYGFMQSYFPRYPIVADSKKLFSKQRRMERGEALQTQRWITFNHSWINTLIFDLDYPISLREAYNLALDKIGIEPTWITETDKGVHIAYALTNMVQYDWHKTVNLLKHIKVAVSKELAADERGSHRLKGYWRNPLAHNFYSSLKTYSLEDFYHISNKYKNTSRTQSPQERFTKDRIKRQIKYNNFKFYVGNRNYSLWYTAMQHTNAKMSEEEIRDVVLTLHHEYTRHRQDIALPTREVNTITASVIKYNKKNSNYVSSSSYQEREKWNVGAMKFETMKGLTRAEYEKETTRRKQAAAHYTANKKATKTKKAITDAIYRLKFLLLNTTVRNIAAYAGRSVGTISRYLKEADIQALMVCSISSKHWSNGGLSSRVLGGSLFRISETLFLSIDEITEDEIILLPVERKLE